MFPPPQIPGQGLLSPGAPRVPPGLAENHPVNRPTSSSSNPPPKPPSGATRGPPTSLPMKRFQPYAEPRRTDVARIPDLPPLPDMSNEGYDADDESNDSSELGGAEGKLPISLKQTEFTLK